MPVNVYNTIKKVIVTTPEQGVKVQKTTNKVNIADKRGAQGLPGTSGAFGYAYYFDTTYTEENPLQLLAGVRTPINFQIASVLDVLKTPYVGHTFFEGGKFNPFAVDDVYNLRFNFDGESSVINNVVRAQIDIGGTQNVIDTDRVGFDKDAGQVRKFTIPFLFFSKETYLANNGEIFLTANQDAEVWDFTALVVPHSTV